MKNTILFTTLLLIGACNPPKEKEPLPPLPSALYPERARDMTIYEVNIRQHTPEGTFNAFQQDLPRLKELGVDMLWIMPIQPIGAKNRKGSLGSYYSIRDYKATNPEFGTLDEFKNLVNKAHELGFQVILDWVPNHTSWDNTWITEHPEYYMTDSAASWVGKQLNVDPKYYKKSGTGNLVYEADWDDIALLNLYNAGARAAMIDAMKFWITDVDIDGFRCDHAGHEIPLFFWEEATTALDPLKDLFWLAEWDEPRMHLTFDATYEWELLHLTEDVAAGKKTAEDIHAHILKDLSRFGHQALRLNMINNHDENAWAGTVKERYGKGERAMAAFSFVAYGVPVLYSGQEVGLDKRLRFFEKDTIDMSDPDQLYPFYQKLNQIKAENPALWSGNYSAMPTKLNDGNINVFSTKRANGDNTVIAIINMSDKEQAVTYNAQEVAGSYTNAFTGDVVQIDNMKLSPWQYLVLTK